MGILSQRISYKIGRVWSRDNRGVATLRTHARAYLKKCRRKVRVNLFVAHAHSKKKTYKKLFQSLLGRTIEYYLFAYKQLSNLVSVHSYTFYLVSEAH